MDKAYPCLANGNSAETLPSLGEGGKREIWIGVTGLWVDCCSARWRENRTIFNTPNARLMNVSLLRDHKLLHGQERRGSRASVRAPSRQSSMASLRAHSPNASQGAKHSQRVNRTGFYSFTY